MRFHQCVLAALALGSMGGCATITRGVNEDLRIETDPAGARVSTSAGPSCAPTPCDIRLPRRSDVTVRIDADGYQSVETRVRGRLSAFVPAGVVGAAVDVASGAALSLRPNPLRVTLEPGSGVRTIDPDTLQPEPR
jgi:hypothetical protein